MNKRSQMWVGGLAAMLAFGLLLGSATAQMPEPNQPDQPRRDPGQPGIEKDKPKDIPGMTERDMSGKDLRLIRASQLWGTETTGQDGKNLGEIDNLAIDRNTGKISYAVLSVGGLMDIGDKLFAIPWSTLEIVGTKNNQVTLPFARDKFEKAEGFDEEKWPSHADSQFSVAGERYPGHEGKPGEHGYEGSKSKGAERGMAMGPVVKLTDVLDKSAKSTGDQDLGTIKDVVIDQHAGRIAYLAVGSGELHAVPWSVVRVEKEGEVRLDIDKDQLAAAPVVNWDQMSQMSTRSWLNNVYVQFNASPYWEEASGFPERERKAK